jgi:hypothetical protein
MAERIIHPLEMVDIDDDERIIAHWLLRQMREEPAPVFDLGQRVCVKEVGKFGLGALVDKNQRE